jgi:excisionase family DNA binding protein
MGRPRSTYAPRQASYVGTKDAAAILGVSVSTVHKMLARGRLRAWQTAGGHRRLDVEELRRLAYDPDIPSDQKRIMVDTLKWQKARAAPKRFGDKTLIGSDPENPLPAPMDMSKLSAATLRELAQLATDG